MAVQSVSPRSHAPVQSSRANNTEKNPPVREQQHESAPREKVESKRAVDTKA